MYEYDTMDRSFTHIFSQCIFTCCIRPRYLTTVARAVVGVVKAGTYLGSNSITLGDDAYAPQVMCTQLVRDSTLQGNRNYATHKVSLHHRCCLRC
jgi:hypothetical protein